MVGRIVGSHGEAAPTILLAEYDMPAKLTSKQMFMPVDHHCCWPQLIITGEQYLLLWHHYLTLSHW